MNSTFKYLSSTFLIAFSMVSFSIKANSEPIKLDNRIASASNTSKQIFSTSYTRKNIKIGLSTESSTIPVSSSVNGAIFLLKDGELTKILDINPKQYCVISNKNGLLEKCF